MEKDFTQFGGWLKFFYILLWIKLALSCLAIPAEIYFRLSDDPKLAQLANGVGFFESIVMGIVCWFCIKNIKLRTAAARSLIQQLAMFLVVAIFLLAALHALLSGRPFLDVFDYPNHVLMPLTLWLYFSHSKRAQLYYQLPEEEQVAVKISREESKAVAHGMVRMYSITLLAIVGIMAFSFLLVYVTS